MDHDWSFEAVRVCRTCHGSGKPPPRSLPPGAAAVGPGPIQCPTCGGTKEERKRITLAELKDLLAL